MRCDPGEVDSNSVKPLKRQSWRQEVWKNQGSYIVKTYRPDPGGGNLLIRCSYANEGLPQAVLQAPVMEKRIVARKVGGISEAVFDRVTGYLVPPRYVQALTRRVIDLAQDDLKRTSFCQTGRRLVKERYSLEGMLDRIEQLYETL